MAQERPFEGTTPAAEVRAALARRDAWVRGFRKHLVRKHGSNRPDSCGCGVSVPAYVLGADWAPLGDDRLGGWKPT